MVEQYGLKRAERLANSLPFMFKEYPGFQAAALTRVEENLLALANKKRFDMAANQCIEWIPNVRKAFLYFHRYNRGTLGLAVSLTFILWNVLLYTVFSKAAQTLKLSASKDFKSEADFKKSIWIPSRVFAALILIELLLGVYQKWPFMHLVYVTLPAYLASLIARLVELTPATFIDILLNSYSSLKLHLLGYFVGFGKNFLEISLAIFFFQVF